MAEQLEDLEIDRVDGVDDPATKRKFLLMKSGDPSELAAEVDAISNAAESALTFLTKSAHDRKTAKALRKLATLMDLEDLEFRIRKDEAGVPPVAAPVVAPVVAAALPATDPNAVLVAAIKSAFSESMGELRKSLDALPSQVAKCLEKAGDPPPDEENQEEEPEPDPEQTPKAKSRQLRAVRSSQPRGQVTQVRKSRPKFGEGMFHDVFYGPSAGAL